MSLTHLTGWPQPRNSERQIRVAALYSDWDRLTEIREAVEARGYSFVVVPSAKLSLSDFASEDFDLVMLGWKSSGDDAMGVIQWIRQDFGDRLPIILVSEAVHEAELWRGLNAGADDYIVEPLRAVELHMRMSAALRRANAVLFPRERNWTAKLAASTVGAYHFSAGDHVVEVRGKPVQLARREYDLAYLMFRHVGRLLARSRILASVWGADAVPTSRSIDTHVSRVRFKLNLIPENGYVLSAVHGRGYRLDSVLAREIQ